MKMTSIFFILIYIYVGKQKYVFDTWRKYYIFRTKGVWDLGRDVKMLINKLDLKVHQPVQL